MNLVTLHLVNGPNPSEEARVSSIEGCSVSSGRVKGKLMPSRCFGDFDLAPCVIATPSVCVHDRAPADEYIVLSSDGLHNDPSRIDALTQQAFITFDRDTMFAMPHFVCNGITDSTDNRSCIILFLREWEHITKQVDVVQRDKDAIHRLIMYELECAREDSVLQDLRTISRQQLASEPAAAQHVLTEELRTQYLSRFKGHPAFAAPRGCELPPVVFSHWGDLVAVHTRPLLPDPGWRRFVPAHMHDLVTLERVINVHKIMTRAQTTPNAEHYAKQRPYVDAAFDMVRRRLARRLARRIPHRLGVVFCVRPSIRVR